MLFDACDQLFILSGLIIASLFVITGWRFARTWRFVIFSRDPNPHLTSIKYRVADEVAQWRPVKAQYLACWVLAGVYMVVFGQAYHCAYALTETAAFMTCIPGLAVPFGAMISVYSIGGTLFEG